MMLVTTMRVLILVLASGLIPLALPMGARHPVAKADECPPVMYYQPACQYDKFYTPPDPIPHPLDSPGDIIRTEPAVLRLEPSGQLGGYVADGTRIMYQSTNNDGAPVAVTGMYFEPHNPWPGAGPRPLIAIAPSVAGIGDQCALSRQFSEGIHYGGFLDLTLNYEEGFVATMVARGFAVVVTDYQGVGTFGPPSTFMRLPQGYALLDAARAALRLPGTSLASDGPVALWGYGQGGGAAGAAVELAPSYAPDLHIVGAWLGAPAADIAVIPPYADGSLIVGGLGFLLNGIMGTYPQAREGVMSTLTPRGVDLVEKTRYACVGEMVIKFMFRHVQPYFNTDYMELLGSEPVRSLLAAQRVGTLKPVAPVQIDINRYDPYIPWVGAAQLARDWCAQGADVEFWTNEAPPIFNKLALNDLLIYFVEGERGMQWVADRFNGVPTTPNCGHDY